ncbi:MAG: hypothetical protein QXJ06_00520 [Candidatus Aenigmatarchaeota archaeon]
MEEKNVKQKETQETQPLQPLTQQSLTQQPLTQQQPLTPQILTSQQTQIADTNTKQADELNYNYTELLKSKIIQQIPQQSIGTLELTEEQQKILFEEPNDEDILIRPDGLIYLNWTWYAERLRRAFGLQWQLIPSSEPVITKNNQGKPTVIWGFYLFIKGICMGYALGEHTDQREKTLSFGEACESAKSNALMRLCKGIGMSLKLWNKEYVDYWISNYARKDAKGYWEKIPSLELKQKRENFIKAIHALGLPEATYRKALNELGYNSSKDVPYNKMTEVYLKLKAISDELNKTDELNRKEVKENDEKNK